MTRNRQTHDTLHYKEALSNNGAKLRHVLDELVRLCSLCLGVTPQQASLSVLSQGYAVVQGVVDEPTCLDLGTGSTSHSLPTLSLLTQRRVAVIDFMRSQGCPVDNPHGSQACDFAFSIPLSAAHTLQSLSWPVECDGIVETHGAGQVRAKRLPLALRLTPLTRLRLLTAQLDAAWRARTHPRVLKLFEAIWETPRLVVSMDSVCCEAPCKAAPKRRCYLHVDQRGGKGSARLCVQGVLSLSNTTEDTGGTTVLPRSHAVRCCASRAGPM